jgi:hypothetical protein
MVGMVADAMRGFLESGMDPADVAAHVVDAVRTRRFYVLTHDDTKQMVRKRMEAILEGDDPPMIGPENF